MKAESRFRWRCLGLGLNSLSSHEQFERSSTNSTSHSARPCGRTLVCVLGEPLEHPTILRLDAKDSSVHVRCSAEVRSRELPERSRPMETGEESSNDSIRFGGTSSISDNSLSTPQANHPNT